MTPRKTLTGIIAAALLITVLPGAILAQADAAETPEGVVWALTSTSGTDVPTGVEASLYMEDGEANGNGGCNSFSGTYEIDGSILMFDPNMLVTQAYCEGPAQETEDAYLSALPTVASWVIDGAELSLADASGAVVLTYVEPLVDVTETDVIALSTSLQRLNERISNTRQDVRHLQVPKLRERVAANQAVLNEVAEAVKAHNVPGLRDRVVANEAVLNEITDRFVNLRARMREIERRIAALEEAMFTAVPSDE